ncbi:MAG: 50S ribosomal protein L22 [Candidatus Harrisonbacteria bacterium CG10_big_fil_rev_8_21_14_0_10_49_15]|uniref:Large ribosomal subunit protein uL22 n=1 Tax=Candidatus Harrisonbacteria bacterium CG10_big_fil_rev_8_21_14_0_10_49_15 TaxID=1974587 RepID=A0A2H0UKX4_9BACT|nr:MAG: 50S ribosomal protein L22 [Candidatus Harrisonbacteria bacterium CG10_big_fil_rev_8_21_14_0_10_49_15]
MTKTQKAQLRYLNITPRKVRLIAATLRGLSTQEAEAQLLLRSQRSSMPLLKLLRSAVANAKNNELDTDRLVISEILVNGGPVLKRYLPRAQGRASLLLKRTSHISLTLTELEAGPRKRFAIVPKAKKDKKKDSDKPAKAAVKKPASAVKREDDSKAAKEAKPGTLKKMFQRKSV